MISEINIFSIFPLIAAVFALFLGSFVLFKNSKSSLNKVFALLCFETAYWQICWFLSYLFPTPLAKDLLSRIAFSVIIFIPFTYYQVALLFLKNNDKRNYVFLGYLFGLIFLVLTWTSNLFIAGYRDFGWGSYPKAGLVFSVYLAGVLFFITRALFLILKPLLKKEFSPGEQNRIKFMSLAHCIYYFAAIEYLIDLGLPLYPLGVFFFIVSFSIIAYAITKHHLMNISLVISRSLAWVLTVLFVGSIYSILVWLYRTFVTTQIDLAFLAWTLFFGMIVGETFQKIRLFLQTTTDKAFVKPSYEPAKVLGKLVSGLSKTLTSEKVARLLFCAFNEDIDVSPVQIYFTDKKGAKYFEWDPQSGKQKADAFCTPENHLVKQLLIRQDMVTYDKKIAIPCLSDNQLIAFIVLGKKRNEDDYSDDDLKLFKTIGDYVAVTLKHIVKPYEEMSLDLSREKDKVAIAQRELERTHRLQQLGQLTAGIAHEIRNPMMALSSQAELLPERLGDKEFLLWISKMFPEQIFRILNIIQRMLKFARAKEEGLSQVDINNLLEESLSLLVSKIKTKDIGVKKEFVPDIFVHGHPDSLSEAFINLILNAVESMGDGGVLTLSTGQENGNTVIKIRDTGCGIPEDKLDNMGDPFFTTKDEGTGLGLSIAYKIIDEHNGKIDVESKIGKGTIFTITLPVENPS
ncbi:MAG: ATP-binding protein [Candidatus Saganbacteria bacterium]|nr:ATP-binding protein [Candidatus Saganbacteria bacterium]